MNKLRFTIEDATLVDENPNSNFAVLQLDFFASGKNLHDTFVSEETLMRTSGTIRNCPLVWMYDPMTDDIYTHDKNQVPCGFVPESSDIKSRILNDGRTMLSTIAYVWKKYSGDFLSFFKRDGGEKPVSVEMSVLALGERPDGLTELTDYKFEAITVLGSLVSPAIPDAKAVVLSFAQQYKQDYAKEFSLNKYEAIDFTIPDEIRECAKLTLADEVKVKRANSVVLAVARHLANNSRVSPEKVRYIQKNIVKKSNNPDTVSFLGGKQAVEWSNKVVSMMQEIDLSTARYFEKGEETSPMKEQIAVAENSPTEKPVGLETMEKETDNMEKLEEKLSAEEVKPEEKMAEEVKPEEKMAEVEIEVEDKEEEKKEEEEKEEMSAAIDFTKFRSFFSDEEKMAEEIKKFEDGMFADAKPLVYAMFAKMCKMSEDMCKMEEMMAELKKFKDGVDEEKKEFAVQQTLNELSQRVIIPEDARDELVAKAKEMGIEEWKTYAKAKSFDFALVKREESDVMRVGLPVAGTGVYGTVDKNDVWATK